MLEGFERLFVLDIGLHGWIGLGLGSVGCVLMSVGLMWLCRRDRWRDTYTPDPETLPRTPEELAAARHGDRRGVIIRTPDIDDR